MKPAPIHAEVSGEAELREGANVRAHGAMKFSVCRICLLCIVLAAACAAAGESPATTLSPAHTIGQMPRNGDPADAGQAPERPLDVATLKLRLRETTSIGVFAKLALRSEMSELMQQLRWHHQGNKQTSFAELRLLYDQFVLKVLSLIRDGDPPLARAIARSQESIWSVLADPEQFESAG